MAKNYPSLYNAGGYSTALEQKMFIKKETVRGTMVLPTGADFIYHTAGSVNSSKPIEDSPHKSGRHQTNVIEGKTTTPWTLTTLFNIDTSLGAKSVSEIDPALRVLLESMWGKEDVTSGSPVYDASSAPDITFTMMEIGTVWAKQTMGCFVESANSTFPGDGRAQCEWAGQGKNSYLVGIGKSILDNNANTVTLAAGEGKRFPVGAKVMIVKADNSKSADTPAGSARNVVSVAGDVVTLDGAVLADADGSGVGAPVYLVYFEPETATAIDDPQTGLQGSISIDGAPFLSCIRSFGINGTNNHEIHSNCYGEDGLGDPLFSAAGKLNVEVTMEVGLTKELVGFYNDLKNFEGVDATLILGDALGRHLQIELPKVIFNVPEVTVPDTGVITVPLTGSAKQTDIDEGDEITLSFL